MQPISSDVSAQAFSQVREVHKDQLPLRCLLVQMAIWGLAATHMFAIIACDMIKMRM